MLNCSNPGSGTLKMRAVRACALPLFLVCLAAESSQAGSTGTDVVPSSFTGLLSPIVEPRDYWQSNPDAPPRDFSFASDDSASPIEKLLHPELLGAPAAHATLHVRSALESAAARIGSPLEQGSDEPRSVRGAASTSATTGTGKGDGLISGSRNRNARFSAAKLPVRHPLFERNRGQFSPDVEFLAHANGASLSIGRHELVLSVRQAPITGSPVRANTTNQVDTLRMKFVGSNPRAAVDGLEPGAAKVSYLIGNDPAKWQTGVPTYGRVRISNLYPGIDLICYAGTQGQLEFDLVAKPGADINRIHIRPQGDRKQQPFIDANGDLRTDGGSPLFLHYPVVYQNGPHGKEPVTGRFAQLGKGAVGFKIARYDHTRPLVIDPTFSLSYSTFLGGVHQDDASGLALDGAGNIYIVGASASEDFPVTSNAIQSTRNNIGRGTVDATISKFTASGILLYSTYFGGSGTVNEGTGIAVDASDNIYLTGYTNSPDFPTTSGAIQPTLIVQGTAAFASELSADGSKLLYSTYLNGGGDALGYSITLDSKGRMYVAGEAAQGFPTTSGAFLGSIAAGSGYTAAFVSLLDPTQSGSASLLSSTYYGTAAGPPANCKACGDPAYVVTLDASGNVWLGGQTGINTLPTTSNAIQQSIGALGTQCPTSPGPAATPLTHAAYMAELSADLSTLKYGSYFSGQTSFIATDPPGDCGEFLSGIAFDQSGNIFVDGYTNSATFPTTAGAFQQSFPGYESAFLARLTPDASKVSWASYLGGNAGFTFPSGTAGQFCLDLCVYGRGGLTLDAQGNPWVAGFTGGGNNFPITSNALKQSLSNGLSSPAGQAGFFTGISSDGTQVLYSTFIGDDQTNVAQAAFDATGNAYLVGSAGPGFPVTQDAFQTQFANGASTSDGPDQFFSMLSLSGAGGGSGSSGGSGASSSGGSSGGNGGSSGGGSGGDRVISSVTPATAGNAGDVSITVAASGIEQGATAVLSLNGTSFQSSTSAIAADGSSGTFTFPLSGAVPGSYELTITNPDSSVITKPAALTVEAGSGAKLWVTLSGRSAIRQSTPSTFYVSYGNTGDTNAYGSFLILSRPATVSYSPLFNTALPPPVPNAPDPSTIPTTVNQGDLTYAVLFLPVVAPGTTSSLAFQLSAPSSVQDIPINAYILPPLATSLSQLSAPPTPQIGAAHFDIGSKDLTSSASNCFLDLMGAITTSFVPAIEQSAIKNCLINGGSFINSVIQAAMSSSQSGGGVSVLQASQVTTGGVQTITNCAFAAAGAAALAEPGVAEVQGLFNLVSIINNATALGNDCAQAYHDFSKASQDAKNKSSIDPNEKTGDSGDGSAQGWIPVKPLQYFIGFENQPSATAAAARVAISDQLDGSKFDLSGLSLSSFSIGSTVVDVPPGLDTFGTTVPINSSMSVSVQGSLNRSTGLLQWIFQTVDPSTGQPPSDPTVGFLPPDTDGISGQGGIGFNVPQVSGLATGTQFANMAAVVFDNNAPIDTATWTNTLDVDAPTSMVAALPAQAPFANFPVSWSGADKGSGIASFTIFVSDNGGSFTPWLIQNTGTSGIYPGVAGHRYAFFSIAEDAAGNPEAPKSAAEAVTVVPTPTSTGGGGAGSSGGSAAATNTGPATVSGAVSPAWLVIGFGAAWVRTRRSRHRASHRRMNSMPAT